MLPNNHQGLWRMFSTLLRLTPERWGGPGPTVQQIRLNSQDSCLETAWKRSCVQ